MNAATQRRTETKQGTFSAALPSLRQWSDGFLNSRRASGKARGTVEWYTKRLAHFVEYCRARNVVELEAVDAGLLREYLLALAEAGHNGGGQHGYFRAVRALFLWYEREAEPPGWRNPIHKVDAPKVNAELLEPAPLADVAELAKACAKGRHAARDKAIVLTLLDTGMRASELTALDAADFEPVGGALQIRKGKGGKGRTVFLGQKARKAVRAYLRDRPAGTGSPALFITEIGGRFTYWGLRTLVDRMAKAAGVQTPPLHSFRRAFALGMLRAGVDVVTIQRAMGHSGLGVLLRYLKQDASDVAAAVERASLADRL